MDLSFFKVVQRSIARVHFKWRNDDLTEGKSAGPRIDMVIPGIIVSVKNGKCLMFVDPSFFRAMTRFSFHVSLPTGDGTYGKSILVTPRRGEYIMHEEFYGFVVKAELNNEYVAAAMFETSPLKQCDTVHTFLFAREEVISTAYSTGHIVSTSQSHIHVVVAFHDCALHEYGHFGSPIFNKNGHLLGICYATQSRTHAWTVKFLRRQFDILLGETWSVTYINPSQEGGLNPSSSSSSSVHCAPAPLPLGVVTVGCKDHKSSPMKYFTGIIIFCERGQDNEHTTFVFSLHKALKHKAYVYFERNERIEAKICSVGSHHMILQIKDRSFHEPITWGCTADPHPRYQLVKSISVMAGTKLNEKVTAPIIKSLLGVLGSYNGQITTPRCHAATASSCTILSGTEKYFQLSCSYQDDLVNFVNIDDDRDAYECDSMISAPVFNLKGEFVGVILSSGNWPDNKTGIYSEWLLPIVENLMKHFCTGWSKDKLKWSSAQSV